MLLKESEMSKNLHVIFKGQVQGVGFRYTAQAIARELDVKGWVKNLHSGEVEISAESDEHTLKEYLRRLEDRFAGYISGADVEWNVSKDELGAFEIRF